MMNTRKTSAKEIQRSGVLGSEVQGFSPSAGGEAASPIEKETYEHRTLNVRHRIRYSVNLNNMLSKANLPF